ncbi:MAG: S9 family peptidase [Bacillota bacterium]
MSDHSGPLPVEDLFALHRFDDAQVSPDGGYVAFIRADYAKTDNNAHPASEIWLVSTVGGDERPITLGSGSCRLPRWSPRSNTAPTERSVLSSDLAFVSDRRDPEKGVHLPYVLRSAGGEGQPVAGVTGSVVDMAWLPDGRHLLLLVTDPETEEEKSRGEDGNDRILFEEETKYQRLWLADTESDRATVISPSDMHIWEFDLSHDGQQVVALVTDEPHAWCWYDAELVVLDLPGEVEHERDLAVRPLYRLPANIQMARPTWSPNGDSVAFLTCTCSDPGLVTGDVWLARTDGAEPPLKLTPRRPISVNWIEWISANVLLAMGYEEGRLALARIVMQGGEASYQPLWNAERGSSGYRAGFSLADSKGTLAMTQENDTEAAEIWVGTIGDATSATHLDWKCLTSLNSHTADWPLGETETIYWRAPDGLRIQGLLVKPVGYTEGTRYPLVVHIHGGPTILYTHRFYAAPDSWAQLLASRGFAVLMPNPRGSAGWGTEFSSANVGVLGEGDFADIMAGVDHCIASGIADPDRLGVGGASFGGYMTAWTITQTDRFRAALMSAGIVNVLSYYGTSDRPNYASQFHAADAYTRDVFRKYSPITYANQVNTPTLIIHGERDECCNVGQAMELHRALRDRVPVRLVIYPREGHRVSERNHMEDVLCRMIDWFERYLTH